MVLSVLPVILAVVTVSTFPAPLGVAFELLKDGNNETNIVAVLVYIHKYNTPYLT